MSTHADRQPKASQLHPRQVAPTRQAAPAYMVDNRPLTVAQRQMQARPPQPAGLVQLQAQPASSQPPVVQLAKSVAERSAKNKRIVFAKRTIRLIAPKFKAEMSTHLFTAEGTNAAPSGLHGYTDGKLPNDVQVSSIKGSPADKHKITWSKGAGPSFGKKESSMFPKWMPKDNLKTLIGLQYPELAPGALPEPAKDDLEAVKEHTALKTAAKNYVSMGHVIPFTKHGDTVYPDN